MEAEIPIALIRSFQSTAREQAGVPWYDPSNPELPGFPASLREAVAEADSAVPHYLKCHQCRTTLPRGLQSATCAHCGVEQRREIPLSLSFISTAAYRNLLESLGLDGSEHVILDAEPQKTSKGKDTVKSDVTLSSLLDIELRWPPERKDTKTVSSSNPTAQSNPQLNLSAADLDNFFIEKKVLSPGIHNASQLSFDSESFDVFQNLRSSDAVTSTNTNEKVQYVSHSTHLFSNSADFAAFGKQTPFSMIEGSANKPDDDSKESFADWQADFQSAGPGTSLFHDSSNLGKAALYHDNEHRKEAETTSEVNHSNADDKWMLDDLQHTSSEVPPNKAKSGTMVTGETGYAMESSSFDDFLPVRDGGLFAPASMNQDDDDDDSFDVWQDFSTSKVPSEEHPNPLTHPVNENISTALNRNDVEDDSYDVWQDFSVANVTFETLPNTITQNVATEKVRSGTSENEVDDPFDVWQDFSSSKGATRAISTGEGSSLSDNATANKSADLEFEDMEFGNFVQSDLSSEVATVHDSSTDSKNISLEADKSDRNDPMEIKQNNQDDIWASNNRNDVSDCTTATYLPNSSSSSVESLLAQMHDLSFMLKDDLSIPRRAEGSNFPS